MLLIFGFFGYSALKRIHLDSIPDVTKDGRQYHPLFRRGMHTQNATATNNKITSPWVFFFIASSKMIVQKRSINVNSKLPQYICITYLCVSEDALFIALNRSSILCKREIQKYNISAEFLVIDFFQYKTTQCPNMIYF